MTPKFSLYLLEDRIVLDGALGATLIPTVSHVVSSADAAHTLYVDPNVAGGDHSGASWSNAYADLQAALNAATAGSSWDIKVAAGSYSPSSTSGFSTNSGASVYIEGGYNPQTNAQDAFPTTVIDGANGSTLFAITNSNVVLSSFTFENGVTSTVGTGGALTITDHSTVLIKNSAFTNNFNSDFGFSSQDGLGGAIYAENSDLYVDHSTFGNNTANTSGGAIASITLFGDFATHALVVNDSTFTGNFGYLPGGALYASQTALVAIDNSSFSNNSAHDNGGAVAIFNTSDTASISNTTFTGNQSLGGAWGGGALFMDSNDSVWISQSTFDNNSSALFGGGVAIINTVNSISVDAVHFTGNTSSSSGGALYAFTNGSLSVSDSFFTDNSILTPGGSGGAIRDNNNGDSSFINNTFDNNTATAKGGAISSTGNSLGTSTYLADHNFFDGNKANEGGALFIGNHFATVTLSNNGFSHSGAQAGSGGAVEIQSNNSVRVDSNSFTDNSASFDGGALAATDNFSLEASNNNFTTNAAVVQGGAVYDFNNTTTQFSGNTFTDNNVGEVHLSGGAIVGTANRIISESGVHNTLATAQTIGSSHFGIDTDPNLQNSSDPSVKILGELTGDDHDFYRVFLRAGETLTADIDNNVTNPTIDDTTIDLVDPNGIHVAFNDDAPPPDPGSSYTGSQYPGNSLLTYTAVVSGFYTIDLAKYTPSVPTYVLDGNYALNLSINEGHLNNSRLFTETTDSHSSNDTAQIINVADFGVSADPNLQNPSLPSVQIAGSLIGIDTDVYRLFLTAGDKVTIDVDNNVVVPISDTVVSLVDANGNQLAFNDDAASDSGSSYTPDQYPGNSLIDSFIITESGFYFIKLSKYDGNVPDGNYLLNISIELPSATVIKTLVGGLGGALYIENGAAALDTNTFTHNQTGDSGGALYAIHNTSLTVDSSTFEFNIAANAGGGVSILNTTGDVHIANSSFTSNEAHTPSTSTQAWGGGALYMLSNDSISINNTTFDSNSSGLLGGGVAIINTVNAVTLNADHFLGNSSSSSGGGLYTLTNGSLSVSNSTFTDNSILDPAGGGNGGAIRDNNNGSSSFVNNTFIDNTAVGNGGAIASTGSSLNTSTLFVDHNTFDGNSAAKGGALFIDNYDDVILTVNHFNGNMATAIGTGGALFIDNYHDVTLTDNSFIGNVAATGYDAVINKTGTVNGFRTLDLGLIGTLLADNTGLSSSNLYVFGAPPYIAPADISHTLFVNSGVVGGDHSGSSWANAFSTLQDALAMVTPGVSWDVKVAAGTYIPPVNPLTGEGGYVVNAGTLLILEGSYNPVTNTQSTTPSTFIDGQGINRTAMLIINGSQVIASGFVFQNGVSSSSTGGIAGALSIVNNSRVMLINDAFTGNSFSNYSTNASGAVSVEGSDLFVVHSTFSANSSTFGGIVSGAITYTTFTAGTTHFMDIEDSTFTGNAGTGGGALNINANLSLIINNSVFTSNTSSQGGAIIANSVNATISDCTFANNSASYRGGALSFSGGTITMQNSTFTQNHAQTGDGGAVYLIGTIASLHDNTFNGNTAATNGGAVMLEFTNSPVTMENNIFINNIATGLGGALYCKDNTTNLTVRHNTFTNDQANFGGAIAAEMTSSSGGNIGNIAFDANIFEVNIGHFYGDDLYTLAIPTVQITGNTFHSTAATENVVLLQSQSVNGLPGGGSVTRDNVIASNSGLTSANNVVCVVFNLSQPVYLDSTPHLTLSENDGSDWEHAVSDVNMLSQVIQSQSNTNSLHNLHLLFANGEYRLSSLLSLSNTNVTIEGGGTGVYGSSIDYTLFDGQNVPSSSTIWLAINSFSFPTNLTISDITFTNFKNSLISVFSAVDFNTSINRIVVTNNHFYSYTPAINITFSSFALGAGVTTIADSVFTNNAVLERGSQSIYLLNTSAQTAVTITNTLFSNNTSTHGAIHSSNDKSLSITNCTFSSNASLTNGGVITIESDSTYTLPAPITLSIAHNAFTGNSAAGFGGALFIKNLVSLTSTIDSNTFIDNTSSAGGAIFILNSDSLQISNNMFSHNSAISVGGAIAALGMTSLTITDNTFTGNSSSSGGALYLLGDTAATISGNTFINDTASLGEEVSLVFDQTINGVSTTDPASVKGNLIFDNTGLSADKIFIAVIPNVHQTFYVDVNNHSTATPTGADLAHAWPDLFALNYLIGLQSGWNIAFANGVYVLPYTFNLTTGSNTFTGGAAGAYGSPIGYTLFQNGGAGTAIVVTSNTPNQPTNLSVSGITFSGFTASAISVTGGGNIVVSHSTFLSNQTASQNGGGAFYATNTQSVLIDSSLFVGNSAVNNGGAIYVGQPAQYVGGFTYTGQFGTIAVTNSTFIDNTAGGLVTPSLPAGGGGLYVIAENAVTITNSNFIHNLASNGYGGGVAVILGGPIVVDISQFLNNRSYSSGGGLYTYINDSLVVSNSLFEGNQTLFGDDANGNGAAIRDNINGSSFFIKDIFKNNSSQGFGGGIASTGRNGDTSTIHFDHLTFSGNSAAFGGNDAGFLTYTGTGNARILAEAKGAYSGASSSSLQSGTNSFGNILGSSDKPDQGNEKSSTEKVAIENIHTSSVAVVVAKLATGESGGSNSKGFATKVTMGNVNFRGDVITTFQQEAKATLLQNGTNSIGDTSFKGFNAILAWSMLFDNRNAQYVAAVGLAMNTGSSGSVSTSGSSSAAAGSSFNLVINDFVKWLTSFGKTVSKLAEKVIVWLGIAANLTVVASIHAEAVAAEKAAGDGYAQTDAVIGAESLVVDAVSPVFEAASAANEAPISQPDTVTSLIATVNAYSDNRMPTDIRII